MPTEHREWAEDALLLVGHGSSRVARSSESVRALAEAIDRRKLFVRVRPAFLKEPPLLADARVAFADRPFARVHVVPVLTCRGYICDSVIPSMLGPQDPSWILCDPVGTHPAVAGLVAARIRVLLSEAGAGLGDTEIVLAAHGTGRDPESFRQTNRIAAALAAPEHGLKPAHSVFLEQEPRIEEWAALCGAPNVIVIPFMIAAGAHGSIDLPQRLGLDPMDSAFADLDRRGWAGPFRVAGKSLIYGRAIGSEPAMADLILDQVAARARQFRS